MAGKLGGEFVTRPAGQTGCHLKVPDWLFTIDHSRGTARGGAKTRWVFSAHSLPFRGSAVKKIHTE